MIFKNFICTDHKDQITAEYLVIVESLEPFYSMLKNKDREFWFQEEISGRERLGLKRLPQMSFLTLIFADKHTKARRLRSVHNYDILSNPIYSDKFHYVPAVYPERSDYIISEYKDPWIQAYSTDICRLACDFAYLPKSIAYDLEFDEEKIFHLMLKLRRNHVKDEILETEAVALHRDAEKTGVEFKDNENKERKPNLIDWAILR